MVVSIWERGKCHARRHTLSNSWPRRVHTLAAKPHRQHPLEITLRQHIHTHSQNTRMTLVSNNLIFLSTGVGNTSEAGCRFQLKQQRQTRREDALDWLCDWRNTAPVCSDNDLLGASPLFLSMSSSALFRVYPEGHKLKRSVELEVSTRAGSMAHVYVRRQVYLYVCVRAFLSSSSFPFCSIEIRVWQRLYRRRALQRSPLSSGGLFIFEDFHRNLKMLSYFHIEIHCIVK